MDDDVTYLVGYSYGEGNHNKFIHSQILLLCGAIHPAVKVLHSLLSTISSPSLFFSSLINRKGAKETWGKGLGRRRLQEEINEQGKWTDEKDEKKKTILLFQKGDGSTAAFSSTVQGT